MPQRHKMQIEHATTLFPSYLQHDAEQRLLVAPTSTVVLDAPEGHVSPRGCTLFNRNATDVLSAMTTPGLLGMKHRRLPHVLYAGAVCMHRVCSHWNDTKLLVNLNLCPFSFTFPFYFIFALFGYSSVETQESTGNSHPVLLFLVSCSFKMTDVHRRCIEAGGAGPHTDPQVHRLLSVLLCLCLYIKHCHCDIRTPTKEELIVTERESRYLRNFKKKKKNWQQPCR